MARPSAQSVSPAPAASPRAPAPSDLAAEFSRLLAAGDDRAAAEFLLATGRRDPPALAAFAAGPEFAGLAGPCRSAELGAGPRAGDPAPFLLYQLAGLRKCAAGPRGEAEKKKAGAYYLKRLVADYQGSPYAEKAALLLTEDGFCLTDAGYPECLEWQIKGYEKWLRDYPNAAAAPGVIRKVAEGYLELAGWLEQKSGEARKPWTSPERAELCRGRALELAQHLAAASAEQSPWAQKFLAQLRDSGEPYSIIPASALPARVRPRE